MTLLLQPPTFHSNAPNFPLLNMIYRLFVMLTPSTGSRVAGRRMEFEGIHGGFVGLDSCVM